MKKVLLLTAAFCLSNIVSAASITLQGNISKTIQEPISKTTSSLSVKRSLQTKTRTINLMKLSLSPQAKSVLTDRMQNFLQARLQNDETNALGNRPSGIQLGMSNVPVLDQGIHGTCVTFATTAAIDAAIEKGDYISQLCQLELGNYLESQGYIMSGWNGSWGSIVLSQMQLFGFASKDKEASIGCGGLHSYPKTEEAGDTYTTPEDFHDISENLNNVGVIASPILDVGSAMLTRINTNITLDLVKKSLVEGDRVTFGVILPSLDLGIMGAVGKKVQPFDTWVLTPEIARSVMTELFPAAHEMVITGYDDNAQAIDEEGNTHKGLLTLRNSWGVNLGDKGNFYMSYDYFKFLVIEANRIRFLGPDED